MEASTLSLDMIWMSTYEIYNAIRHITDKLGFLQLPSPGVSESVFERYPHAVRLYYVFFRQDLETVLKYDI